jgi:chromosome segregation protein
MHPIFSGSLTQRRERLTARKEYACRHRIRRSLKNSNRRSDEKQTRNRTGARRDLQTARERQPQLEQERRDAQETVNTENAKSCAAGSKTEYTQAAAGKCTNRRQGRTLAGKKHELGKLPRLWQKLTIEAGWENALESVLRERTGALEVSNLDWAKAFFSDAPPAKLSLFSLSGTANTE